MLYRDQLKRHHPFKLVPPEQFTLHTHRLIQDLQRLLRRVGLKASDPHRIAMLLDGHLDAVASHYCNVKRSRKWLLRLGYPNDLKKAISAARDGSQLRALVPDIDIYKGRQPMVPDLLDVPSGIGRISGIVKLGVLALWKVADAIDAVQSAQSQAHAITKALPLVLEAIDSAHFCFLIHETDVMLIEEPAIVESARLSGAFQQEIEERKFASERGRENGKGRLHYYEDAKKMAFALVDELNIKSLKEARLTLPDELTKRKFGVAESTIRDWFTGYNFKANRAPRGQSNGK